MIKPWIAVDLDGTLAEYHGEADDDFIGKPIPETVDRVKQWIRQGKEVRIFTARADGLIRDPDKCTKLIQDWTEKHIGARLPVTNRKDHGMLELWDDRAIRVEFNSGYVCNGCLINRWKKEQYERYTTKSW